MYNPTIKSIQNIKLQTLHRTLQYNSILFYPQGIWSVHESPEPENATSISTGACMDVTWEPCLLRWCRRIIVWIQMHGKNQVHCTLKPHRQQFTNRHLTCNVSKDNRLIAGLEGLIGKIWIGIVYLSTSKWSEAQWNIDDKCFLEFPSEMWELEIEF